MKAFYLESVEVLMLLSQEGTKAFINMNEALSAAADIQRRRQVGFVQGYSQEII